MAALRQSLVVVRRAPWSPAAPLILVAVAGLTAGLVAASAGGWENVLRSQESDWILLGDTNVEFTEHVFGSGVAAQFALYGAAWSVALAGLLMVCAATERRWLAVAFVAALAAIVAGWVGENQSHLGHVQLEFHGSRSLNGDGGPIGMSIAMYGVVGLLLAVGFVTAVAWAASGSRSRRQLSAGETARRSRRRPALTLAAAVIVTLVLPIIALGLRDLAPPQSASGFSDGNQTIYLLVIAMVIVYLAAVGLARHWSAGSVAAVVVGAALWVPALWLAAGLAVSGSSLLNPPAAGWILWGIGLPAGLIGGAWIASRAGREP